MKNICTLLIAISSSFNLFSQGFFIEHTPDFVNTKCLTLHTEFADFDNDSDDDFMAEDKTKKELLIFKNTSGTTIDSIPIVIAQFSSDFIITDWNNDNLPDILTSNTSGIALILNNGSCTFLAPVTLYIGYDDLSDLRNYLKLADINGDGFIDIVHKDTPAKIYLNQAGSPSVISYLTNITLTSGLFEVADIDLDGFYELYDVISGGDIKVYEDAGSFNFVLQSTVDLPISFSSLDELFKSDLDNDGTNELIVKDIWDIGVLQHTGGFSFSLVYTGDATYQENDNGVSSYVEHISAIKDIDNNGFKDIVIGNSVFFNTNLIFTESQITTDFNYNNTWFAFGDADNDGLNELWWNHNEYYFSGLTIVYSMEYNGTTFNSRIPRWEFYPYLQQNQDNSILDFDGDGDLDIAYHAPRNMIICENLGGGNYNYHKSYIGFGGVSRKIYCLDFNNDGLNDILDYDFSGFTTNIKWMKNLGGYTFQNMGTIASYAYGNALIIKNHADFNGDGLPDIIAIAENPPNIYIDYLQNNGGGFAPTVILHSKSFASIVDNSKIYINDANADGLLDISSFYENDYFSTTTSNITFHKYDGTNFIETLNTNVGTLKKPLGLIDYDFDGFLDILYSGASLYWYKNNAGLSFSASAIIQANPGYGGGPVLDINNDGLLDLAGINKVCLFNGITFEPFDYPFSFGLFEFEATYTKDYDLDGDMDILNPLTTKIYENTTFSTSKIFTKVFYDDNLNGIQDGIENSIGEFPVKVSELGIYKTTDTTGSVLIMAGENVGSFSVISNSTYNSYFTFSTPQPFLTSLTTINPIDTAFIGFKMTSGGTGLIDQTLSNHRCNEVGRLFLNMANISPNQTDNTITVTIPAGSTYSSASIAPTTITGSSILFTINDIFPFKEYDFWVDINLPSTAFMGDTLLFKSTLAAFNGTTTSIYIDSLKIPLTCAFDPNDKSISINNYTIQGDENYVFNNEIEYLIRFQNTGSDTAINIIVRDNLISNFDFSSVQAISSSHNYNLEVDSTGLVTVLFNNIMLPDSSTNFLGSMGYIKFKCKLKSGVPGNTKISNVARIYFDFNPPIFTNQFDFYTMSCRYIWNTITNLTQECANTTVDYTCLNFGLPLNYSWIFDGTFFDTDSIGNFFISSTGIHSLELSITLPACNFDSTLSLNVISSVANLILSVLNDTSICSYESLTVNANYSSKWYLDGSLVSATPSYSITVGPYQFVEAKYTSVGCTAVKSFYLDGILVSPNVTANGYPYPPWSFTNNSVCGDSVHFDAHGSIVDWTIEDDLIPFNSFYGLASSVTFPIYAGATSINVYYYFDSLGCAATKNSLLLIIPQTVLTAVLTSSEICIVNPQVDNIFYNGTSLSFDSVFVSRNGVLVDILPNPGTYGALLPGTYTAFGVYENCLTNMVTSIINPLINTLGPIINNIDTLQTFDNNNYYWFYSMDGLTFANISYSNLILTPISGYYFYVDSSLTCEAYSDTLLFSQIGIYENQTDESNFYFSHNNLIISNFNSIKVKNVTIFDYAGKLVAKFTPICNSTPIYLERGIYIVRLETEYGQIVRRLVKF